MVPSTPPISLIVHFAAPCDVAGARSAEELIATWEAGAGEEAPPAVAAGIRGLKE